MTIRLVVAEFIQADGQTDRHDEADSIPLRLNADAPKIPKTAEVRFKQTNQAVKSI
jgi:hypothetical protein